MIGREVGLVSDDAKLNSQAMELIRVDNPIRTEAEDELGRGESVRSFVDQILGMDISEGLSVGVFGPWGSGKTSFVHLVEELFAERDVQFVEFNPWLFSDSQSLATRFFSELTATFGRDGGLKPVGDALKNYGAAVVGASNLISTLVGIPGLGQLLGPLLDAVAREKGLDELRADVERALEGRSTPLVVFLDDVDRLSFSEIREVFRLVRVTANFPNLVYVIVCDRRRVEQALADGGDHTYGRKYLEKIVQFPFNLPEVPSHRLLELLDEAIAGAVPDFEYLVDHETWTEIYTAIVLPLMGNLRDVNRYAAAIVGPLRALRDSVRVEDILALEAVRLFIPSAFVRLQGTVNVLTHPGYSTAMTRQFARVGRRQAASDFARQEVEALLKAGEERQSVVRAVVDLLFPFGEGVTDPGIESDPPGYEMLERRVAYEPVLRRYLERVEGVDLQNQAKAEAMLQFMDNEDAAGLNDFLRSLGSSLGDVCHAFVRLTHRFEPTHATTGVPVLLNLLPEADDEPSFSDSPRALVRRAVFWTIHAVGTQECIAEFARTILPSIESFSSKVDLLELLRPTPNVQLLGSEEAWLAMASELADEIRGAYGTNGIDEPRAYAKIVGFPGQAGLEPIEPDDSLERDFLLVHSALSATVSSAFGVSWYLPVETMTGLYGTEERARARVYRVSEEFSVEANSEALAHWGITPEAAQYTLRVAKAGPRSSGS